MDPGGIRPDFALRPEVSLGPINIFSLSTGASIGYHAPSPITPIYFGDECASEIKTDFSFLHDES